MPQKKKKLSLEEYRKKLGINLGKQSEKKNKNKRTNYNNKNKNKKQNYRRTQQHPRRSRGYSRGNIEKQISQLERKIMEGDLTEEKEKNLLGKIEKLEKQK